MTALERAANMCTAELQQADSAAGMHSTQERVVVPCLHLELSLSMLPVTANTCVAALLNNML